MTWEIETQGDGLCLLTLTHDRLEASPKTAADVSGPGWMYVLSSMKTLLETGAALAASELSVAGAPGRRRGPGIMAA